MPTFPPVLVWRSANGPRLLAFILLLAGVPVFLRLPLWCDVTLYDVAARTLLLGGVHYRDVFDTNTPGYVWCLTLLRYLLGPSAIAVRIVDLGIVLALVAVLDRIAKLAGASTAARWWAIAGMLSFYPFSSEFIHAQRDVWLAVPMLAAVWLRLRRIGLTPTSQPIRYFWPAMLEGTLWALATWIKPHVIPLAVVAWTLTIRRLSAGSWRIAGIDFAGNLLAGIVLGAAGIAYLVASGTWEHFWIVMTEWNNHYTELVLYELPYRLKDALYWFPPWSLLLVPTLLLVVLSMIDGRVFSSTWRANSEQGPIGQQLSTFWYDRANTDSERFARGVLAGVYFALAFESFVFQRAFLYVHVTETLMMMALWAAHRWNLPAAVLLFFAVFGTLFRIADDAPQFRATLQALPYVSYEKLDSDYRHSLARPGYFKDWKACWTTPTTGVEDARLKDRLKHIRGHVATTDWEELGEIEAYLRIQNVKDRELVCWDEGVHPLYLALGVKPGLRFMHIHNTDRIGPDAVAKVRGELHTNEAIRFVVTDLEWVAYVEYERIDRSVRFRPGRAPGNLVPTMSKQWEEVFPYDGRQAIYRSGGGQGRYIVFAVSQPLGKTE